MTLVASCMFNTGANIQYLHMLVRGEALRQFDMLSAEVRSATSENLTFIILGFCAYFFPVNAVLKKKPTIHHGMRKPRVLKSRQYSDCLIVLKK